MRLGQVIGTVNMAHCDPAYRGGKFVVVQPLSREQIGGAPLSPLAKGISLVVFDTLGAGQGHTIGFVEGAEATAPFDHPMPIDAYNAAIIDRIFYTPPAAAAAGAQK